VLRRLPQHDHSCEVEETFLYWTLSPDLSWISKVLSARSCMVFSCPLFELRCNSSYLLERLDALHQALEIDSTNSAKGIEHLAIHSQTTRQLEKPLFSRRRSCRLSHPDCFFPAYPASPEGPIVLRLHTPTWNRPIFMAARIAVIPNADS